MRVLYFGRLRDAAGVSSQSCAPPAEVVTIADLREWLAGANAALGEALRAPGVRMAMDQKFCTLETPIGDAEEIAFMAPFSGG